MMTDAHGRMIMAGTEIASSIRKRFGGSILIALFLFLFAAETRLQTVPPDSAPPPLRLVTKEELAKLDSTKDVKKRTQYALELMEVRLTKAEELITLDQLDQMHEELGRFHGLMDNTLDFLNSSDRDSRKVLNNYKRFEMGLRKFRPRLELIRRDIPLRYEPYVRNLIGYVREARAKAVEPLFGDSVVPRTKP